MSLRFRALTVAYATANFVLLAPALAFAAKEGEAGPPKPVGDYGEDKALNLPLGDPARQAADPTGASGGGSLVRTFVGLAIVVAVIYGLYWILRQVKSGREERATGAGLESRAVVPLGPGRSLHLVQAGRELVLVGVADHGITPIRTYTEAEAEALGLTGADAEVDDFTPVDAAPSARPKRPAGSPMTIGDVLDKLRARTVRA